MGQTLGMCNSQAVVQRVEEADSDDEDGMFGLRSLVGASEQELSESEEASSLSYPVSSRGSAYETAGSDEEAAETDDSQGGQDLINSMLPNEILWLIFTKLEEPRDWSASAVVCRKWLSLLPSVIACAPSPDDLTLCKKERRRRQALQRQLEERRVILAGPVVSETRLLALSVGAHGKNRLSKVEFVDCPKITDTGFSALASACKALRLVSISECGQLSGEAFAAVGHCQGLEVLRLHAAGISDSALGKVARGCAMLQELSLSDCDSVGDEGLTHVAASCRRLKRLELSGQGGLTDAGIRAMEIPTLKHFLLKRMRGVTEAGLVAFVQGASSRKLRTLTLSRSPAATDEALSQVARHATSLRAITLSRCARVTNKALQEIAAHSPSLQHLTLLGCPGVGDQGLESVLSRQADTLEKLCVNKCKGVRDGAALALAGPCTAMRVLELSGLPNMTDKCLAAVVRACPNLQEVDCAKSPKVGDVGAMALAQTCSRSLKNVSLRGCSKVTDKSLAALSLCKLKVLVLSGCSISDAGLVGLIRSTCGRNLISLSVSKCVHVTDACLPQLVNNLKNLWSLDIRRCPQITRQGVRLLNTGRFGAKCTILDSHPSSASSSQKAPLECGSGRSSPSSQTECRSSRKRSSATEKPCIRPHTQRASWKILMQ